MNNKGFTMIEVLAVLVIVSIVIIAVVPSISSSLSLGKNEALELMKNNVVSSSYSYISECETGTILCDFSFDGNNTFKASVLVDKGYFSNLNSPVDGKALGECLVLKASRDNGVVIVDLIDNC